MTSSPRSSFQESSYEMLPESDASSSCRVSLICSSYVSGRSSVDCRTIHCQWGEEYSHVDDAGEELSSSTITSVCFKVMELANEQMNDSEV